MYRWSAYFHSVLASLRHVATWFEHGPLWFGHGQAEVGTRLVKLASCTQAVAKETGQALLGLSQTLTVQGRSSLQPTGGALALSDRVMLGR